MQSHDALSISLFVYKSSPHRPFCRCQRPVAFIFVAVAICRSLSVRTVIAGSVIVLEIVAMKPALSRKNEQQKNTSQPGQVASTMLHDKKVLGNAIRKK
ncbi:MAG: hypothetical protein ISR74_06530 [Candidatus Thioglobus sp.]|jgi:hypothetical protein|nr:hypothetical protein [Candidatus Thioglobus sp.]